MEINRIKLKVYSDNRKYFEIDIDDTDWMLMEEPDISFTNEVSIQILGKVKNERKYKQVGIISGTYFKLCEAMNQGASLYDIFDNINEETLLLYNTLIDKDEDIDFEYTGMKFNIFFIDAFYIQEEFRNQGIGEKVLDQLNSILNFSLNLEVGGYIAILKSITRKVDDKMGFIEEEELSKKLNKKLLRFFNKCGYTRIGKTDFMYLNTDYLKTKRNLKLL